jgi:hypothetical protein
MINFENLGYKDITKVSPIHFSEYFGETFETLYPYEQRFYKKDDNITTILKVGIHNNTLDIAGICYYYNKWYKFEIHTHSKYVKEEFDKTINAIINKLKNEL